MGKIGQGRCPQSSCRSLKKSNITFNLIISKQQNLIFLNSVLSGWLKLLIVVLARKWVVLLTNCKWAVVNSIRIKKWDVWYISNVSTFSHAFPLVLDSNWRDLAETNPGLTLFSVELPWCSFCAEIKVLGMTWNFTENIFGINKKYWRKNQGQGAHTLSTRVGGTPPASWAPWCSTDLNSNSIYSRSGRKKIREKDSSRFTIWSYRQALNSLGRADLESVRGSGEGNPSPSSSSTILHHQFHDAHRRAWVIPS